MALIHMDSFDHYGGDVAQMTRGTYAQAGGTNFALTTSRARTGARSLNIGGNGFLRYALPLAVPTAGMGMVMWFDSLPVTSGRCWPVVFSDHANIPHINVMVQTTGAIEISRGDNVFLGTSAPVITTGAWQHVEARCKVHASTGEVEVRVNGVTAISLTGINTVNPGAVTAQGAHG